MLFYNKTYFNFYFNFIGVSCNFSHLNF